MYKFQNLVFQSFILRIIHVSYAYVGFTFHRRRIISVETVKNLCPSKILDNSTAIEECTVTTHTFIQQNLHMPCCNKSVCCINFKSRIYVSWGIFERFECWIHDAR